MCLITTAKRAWDWDFRCLKVETVFISESISSCFSCKCCSLWSGGLHRGWWRHEWLWLLGWCGKQHFRTEHRANPHRPGWVPHPWTPAWHDVPSRLFWEAGIQGNSSPLYSNTVFKMTLRKNHIIDKKKKKKDHNSQILTKFLATPFINTSRLLARFFEYWDEIKVAVCFEPRKE